MRFLKSAAILSGLVLASQAGAAEIFLSGSPLDANSAPTQAAAVNPVIATDSLGNATVYMYVKLLPLTPNTHPGKVPTERLNSLGADLLVTADAISICSLCNAVQCQAHQAQLGIADRALRQHHFLLVAGNSLIGDVLRIAGAAGQCLFHRTG